MRGWGLHSGSWRSRARFRRHFLVIALEGPESHGPAAAFRSFVLARTALKPAGGFAQGKSAKGR